MRGRQEGKKETFVRIQTFAEKREAAATISCLLLAFPPKSER